ncbi:general secretion pathway protein GspB [Thermodesulfobacteriota bacterium]
MSYILEALKKSDTKRKQGKIPDIDTVQTVSPPEREKQVRWPYFLFGALVLNAMVFAVYISTDSLEETGGSGNNPVQEHSATLPENAKTENTIPAYELKKMAMPVVRSLDRPGTGRAEPVPLEQEPEVVKNGENQEQAAAVMESDPPANFPQDPETEILQEAGSFSEIPVTEPSDTELLEPLPGPELTAELPRDQGQGLTHSGPAQSTPKVVPIHQLPPKMQNDLPEFRISVHGYAQTPESRIVSINGRVLREGDRFGKGLQLDEIIEDGVILSYQGKKFKVELY